jgi:hypothetical protein
MICHSLLDAALVDRAWTLTRFHDFPGYYRHWRRQGVHVEHVPCEELPPDPRSYQILELSSPNWARSLLIGVAFDHNASLEEAP